MQSSNQPVSLTLHVTASLPCKSPANALLSSGGSDTGLPNLSDATNDPRDRGGTLIGDDRIWYIYAARNHLVKVTRKQDTDIVIQTAGHDGLGRRLKKVVTPSGDLDGTYVYLYAETQTGGSLSGASPGGRPIVEIRDDSSNVLRQVYHDTQYIDEILAMRLEKGNAVVYQYANWITSTDCFQSLKAISVRFVCLAIRSPIRGAPSRYVSPDRFNCECRQAPHIDRCDTACFFWRLEMVSKSEHPDPTSSRRFSFSNCVSLGRRLYANLITGGICLFSQACTMPDPLGLDQISCIYPNEDTIVQHMKSYYGNGESIYDYGTLLQSFPNLREGTCAGGSVRFLATPDDFAGHTLYFDSSTGEFIAFSMFGDAGVECPTGSASVSALGVWPRSVECVPESTQSY